ncbi:TPA: hypothetical protein ACHWJ6_000804 [Streptococcus suis]
MSKLKLTLYGENGYQKVVTENYVSGQKLLDYLKLLDDFEKSGKKLSTADYIVRKIEFVSSLFTTEKVTPEEILKGVRSWELVDVIDDILNVAMGAKGEDPKPESSRSERLESDI